MIVPRVAIPKTIGNLFFVVDSASRVATANALVVEGLSDSILRARRQNAELTGSSTQSVSSVA